MSSLTIKQRDTSRTFTATLKIGGVAVNLSGASVKFVMRTTSGTYAEAVVQDASIVSASEGTVAYAPQEEDVDNPGNFFVEWQVTFADGKELTFPADGYDELTIIQRLNEDE